MDSRIEKWRLLASEDAQLHAFSLKFHQKHKRDINDTRAKPNASGFTEYNCNIKCLVGLRLLETKTIYCGTLERFLLICMELI